jgi:hypothetical protein
MLIDTAMTEAWQWIVAHLPYISPFGATCSKASPLLPSSLRSAFSSRRCGRSPARWCWRSSQRSTDTAGARRMLIGTGEARGDAMDLQDVTERLTRVETKVDVILERGADREARGCARLNASSGYIAAASP